MPLETTRRVSRSAPCPICNRPDWCLVARHGGYAICMRVPSDRPARGAGGGYVHRLADRPPGDGLDGIPPPNSRPSGTTRSPPPHLTSPARRNRFFRRLQRSTSLASSHRTLLQQRGFSSEEITGRGYRTLPESGRARLVKQCKANDTAPYGIPGFYRANGCYGQFWTLAGLTGILIPCLAPNGWIRGYQIRPTDPREGGKYRWLSSANRPGGTSSGVHCHVARPLSSAISDEAVWITEGIFKADLAAERLGTIVLSIPGVACWRQALPDLVELLPFGGEVVVAMDADWRANVAVQQAVWCLSQVCGAAGYSVEVAVWEPTHKGLDDLLTAGLRPQRTVPSTSLAPAWTPKVSSRRLAEMTATPRTTAGIITLAAMRARLPEMLNAARHAFRSRLCS